MHFPTKKTKPISQKWKWKISTKCQWFKNMMKISIKFKFHIHFQTGWPLGLLLGELPPTLFGLLMLCELLKLIFWLVLVGNTCFCFCCCFWVSIWSGFWNETWWSEFFDFFFCVWNVYVETVLECVVERSYIWKVSYCKVSIVYNHINGKFEIYKSNLKY